MCVYQLRHHLVGLSGIACVTSAVRSSPVSLTLATDTEMSSMSEQYICVGSGFYYLFSSIIHGYSAEMESSGYVED